jgi:hypothetical protein
MVAKVVVGLSRLRASILWNALVSAIQGIRIISQCALSLFSLHILSKDTLLKYQAKLLEQIKKRFKELKKEE